MKQGRRSKQALFGAIGAVVAVSVAVFCSSLSGPKEANAYWVTSCVSEKCKAAEAAEANARKLQNEAASEKNAYQAEVNRIAADIAVIQARIDVTNEEIVELNSRITNTEKKIATLKESIKQTLIKLYLNSEINELELLASANSFSDYQSVSVKNDIVKNKLKQLATDAKQAKEELEQQKTQLEVKQENNEVQKAESQRLHAEQQSFVNEWAGKESAWSEAAKAAQAEKVAAQESTWIANQSSGGGGTVTPGDPNKGGYPFSYQCPGLLYSGIWQNDGLGMYKCQCVSYTAWKVEHTYGNMPYWGGRGNAYQWIANSQNAGFPGAWGAPKVGSVGVRPSNGGGDVGHVFWVESVNGNGTINLSEYNYTAGDYSYRSGVRASGFYYIYFGDR